MTKTIRNRLCIFSFGLALILLFFIAMHGGAPSVRDMVRGGRDDAATLRVAAPDPARQATVHSPYGPGFEQELVARFCVEVGCTPKWVAAASKEEALELLQQGEVDLVVGFGGDLPAQEGPPAAEQGVSRGASFASGKAYAHFRPIRVRGLPALPNTQETDESTQESEETLPLPAAEGQTAAPGEPPLFSAAMDFDDDPDEDALLLDPASYALWLPLVGEARTERAVAKLIPYRWFWRQNARLADSLSAFWDTDSLDPVLAELTERYYGFLPKKPSSADLLDLADMLGPRLAKYRDTIIKAAKKYNVPPLLLVAVIYQESRFDPDAVSATKVRGIMQLTQSTARMLKVDRNDPEQCIMGGAKYLRELWELTETKALEPWDRWFMALAAFNQGPGSLTGAIRVAQRQGALGTSWTDLKTAYPRLTNSRGYEAVAFVEKVRYYHYILHGLVALSPAETQNLAPLLAAGGTLPGRDS